MAVRCRIGLRDPRFDGWSPLLTLTLLVTEAATRVPLLTVAWRFRYACGTGTATTMLCPLRKSDMGRLRAGAPVFNQPIWLMVAEGGRFSGQLLEP
jgi:hypothetical protein